MIAVAPEHVQQTLDVLRSCGRGTRECVIYWLADLDGTEVIEVVHPRHSATAVDYSVDSGWITRLFVRLAKIRRRVIAQVHSHPGDWVGHSSTDDHYSLIASSGFLSVVCPRFGNVDDPNAFGIYSLAADGRWHPTPKAISW